MGEESLVQRPQQSPPCSPPRPSRPATDQPNAQNGLKTSVPTHTLTPRHNHHSGSGLNCYQCNSYEDALCADPFFHYDENGEEAGPKSGNDFLKACPADTADKEHFCRKIYQNVRGDERVIRSCGWIKDERERECYSTVLEEYNTDVCACKADGCNSATTSSISVIAVLSTMALGYLIH